MRARELAQVAHRGVHTRIRRGVIELRDIGVRILVILVPPHARAHGQQLADGHIVISRAAQSRDVLADWVLEALDVAVLDGRTDQCRGEGLGDREAGPPTRRVEIEPVTLEADPAILQDDEPGSVLRAQVVVDARNLEGFTGGQRERRRRRRDRGGFGEQRDPVHRTESGLALSLLPAQDIAIGGERCQKSAGLLIEAREPEAAGDDQRTEGAEDEGAKAHVSSFRSA